MSRRSSVVAEPNEELQPGPLPNVFLGRQAVLDRQDAVWAYELLFRSGAENRATFSDGLAATSNVIINALAEIGLERAVGNHDVLINCPDSILTSDLLDILPVQRVVLEVLEDVTPTATNLAALKQLTSKGFRIALDDFVYRPELEPLLEIAHFVKLDLMQLDRAALTDHVRIVRRHNARLVAEKIDNHADHELCKKLGFDYFQGYFLLKPSILTGRRPPSNTLALLRLLARLQQPDVSLQEIEQLVSQDVSLSYRLLRLLNSVSLGVRQEITTVQRAVVMLGLQKMRHWLTILSLGGITGKPPELMTVALIRAAMCRRLAVHQAYREPDIMFTVGLFSVLDALLDLPMSDIVRELPLAPELTQALVNRTGPEGAILQTVIGYEQGQWAPIEAEGMLTSHVFSAWLDAVSWAEATANGMQAAAE